ncbi:P-loop containing nucleoside triphosphate hydrolase protein [Aspergillus californicus]
MTDPPGTAPALGAVTLGVFTLLLSIPHLWQLLSDRNGQKSYHILDDDDEEITTDRLPRSIWQRVSLVLVAAAATTAAFSSCLKGFTIPDTVLFISWVTITLQEIVLARCRHPADRYRLGCYSALASLTVGIYLALPRLLALRGEQPRLSLAPRDALTIVQLVASFILLVVNLTLERGPTVYRDGRVIDALESVSFLNRYTFSWAYRTLLLATKNGKLNGEDLPLVAQENRAQSLSDKFFSGNCKSVQWRRWFRLYWRSVTVQVALQVIVNAVYFLPTFLLLTILRLFEDRDAGADNQLQLWLIALGLGLSMMTVSWLTSLRDFVADLKLSLPVNEQLFAAITKKAMSLRDIVSPTNDSEDSEEDQDEDEDEEGNAPRTKHSILNLLGVDVEKFSNFIAWSHLILDCILQLSLSVIFLIFLMGWKPTVIGCTIPVLLSPVYYNITKRYSEKEQALMDRRDEKSSSLTEMVRGIRQIKFSALESEWHDKILKLRGLELQNQQDVFRLNIYLTAIWSLGPICMSFLSIAAYIHLNGSISPATAFTALSLFESLQNTLSILPEVATDLLDARVSLRRIASFLGLEEHQDDRSTGEDISFKDATITWPSNPSETESLFQLKNLTLEFPSNELSIISGRSGAGKSLLLQALIGEADVVSGTVTVPHADATADFDPQDWILDGLLAYVSQDPWIENATIRDAILFGLPWNPSRYDQVIHACSLAPDLKTFPDGDKTDVGANGINLSGGQKWRLALARALYSRASILVLDDIFSAVDAHVGRHLYENALNGSLCQQRTRILATHHVKMCLDGAAYSVELENGRVVRAHRPASAHGDSETESSVSLSRPDSPKPITRTNTRDSISKANKFYEEEKRESGVVKAKVYQAYIAASGGHFLWVLIASLFFVGLLLNLAGPYWVSIWTRTYENEPSGGRAQSGPNLLDKRLVYYGSIYLAITVSSWLLEVFRTLIILNGSIKASKVMFERFTETILRSPLRFLDTAPVGQILNRFTSDFNTLDSDLALDLSYMLRDLIMTLGVVVAAVVTSPLIVGLGIFSLAASWVVAYYYVSGAREVKRLESTAKSPIFELVGSLLTGLPTIRAFGREEAYLKRMYDLIDTHCQALWHRRLFYCWMSFWLSLVGAVFVASVTMIFVSIRSLDAPLAGFALSFALDMSSNISWLLTQYADVELNSNSAERIVEYAELDREPESGIDVSAAWPTNGEIEVTDLTAAYAPDLPPVLQNLKFTIRPGERVGVVGRTGAGKSSLAMTLLRCLDTRSGTIHIDSVDISKIRLHDLRTRVGMISQDPVVFAGTVRDVLDPFKQYDESELHGALEKVSLSSPGQAADDEAPGIIPLTFPIAESGRNLSQGQRQLLCLARALVSRPKILIMDEATASIDMESDARIQRVLREISDCTLLVIAHRLSTIADFDRVIVLDQGTVVEFDAPDRLMEIEGGVYRGMVEGT